MAGEIVNNPSAVFGSANGGKSYLGTSYILSNKADFEPRKKFRFYI